MIQTIRSWVITLAVTTTLLSQNELSFHDGTLEFSTRGAQGTGATMLMQRFPADQLCGASTVVEVTTTFTDWDISTVETGTLEIRRHDPNGPPTGQPDLSPAGLLASGTFTVTFPGPGPAGSGRVVFSLLAALPPALPGPDGDLYVGWSLPASPAWPSDGLTVQISSNLGGNAGEQMSPNTVGYSGQAGQAGMGGQANPATGIPFPMPGDAAFAIGVRFADDVLQPFADNPAVFTGSTWFPVGTGTGQNPNFGYAGIFPDMQRAGGSDGFGVRLRATAAIGSATLLFVGPAMTTTPIPTTFGLVCVDPASMLPGPFLPLTSLVTQAPPAAQPATTSEALFGPFPGDPSAVGFNLHAQCLTQDTATGSFRISTLATIRL